MSIPIKKLWNGCSIDLGKIVSINLDKLSETHGVVYITYMGSAESQVHDIDGLFEEKSIDEIYFDLIEAWEKYRYIE